MHTVEFITLEDEDPDLIVSFALAPQAANSITLHRTPKYESLLPEEERGVVVAAGVLGADDRELLVRIQINTKDSVGSIVSTKRTYELSLTHIEAEDLEDMVALLRRMNFDSRFVVNAALPLAQAARHAVVASFARTLGVQQMRGVMLMAGRCIQTITRWVLAFLAPDLCSACTDRAFGRCEGIQTPVGFAVFLYPLLSFLLRPSSRPA